MERQLLLSCRAGLSQRGLCTRNASRALIERPYSREPQAVGAVYDRPGFFVQSRPELCSPSWEDKRFKGRAARTVSELLRLWGLFVQICLVTFPKIMTRPLGSSVRETDIAVGFRRDRSVTSFVP